MSNKAKVTVELQGKVLQEITGDTVICFTIDEAKEFLNGKAKMITAHTTHVGQEIPKPIFAPTIGSLVGELIESNPGDSRMMVAYNLHCVAKMLEDKSKALSNGATTEEKSSVLAEALKDLFKALQV